MIHQFEKAIRPLFTERTAFCLAAVKHPQLVKLCVSNGTNVNLHDAEVSEGETI